MYNRHWSSAVLGVTLATKRIVFWRGTSAVYKHFVLNFLAEHPSNIQKNKFCVVYIFYSLKQSCRLCLDQTKPQPTMRMCWACFWVSEWSVIHCSTGHDGYDTEPPETSSWPYRQEQDDHRQPCHLLWPSPPVSSSSHLFGSLSGLQKTYRGSALPSRDLGIWQQH